MNLILKQGLFQLVYSTFLHNSQAIGLSFMVFLSLVLSFLRPKRIYLVFMLGFSLLLARVEYLKHFVDPLQRQTVGVVITQEGFYRTRRLFDLFFQDLVPLSLYLAGWGLLGLGLVLIGSGYKRHS